MSSFDWTVPGTPELICECASYAGIPYNYFAKPLSIFRQQKTEWQISNKIKKRKKLYFIGSKLAKNRILSKLQELFVYTQIINSFDYYDSSSSTLFYTNLESIVGILPMLKKKFKKLIYICADYSNLENDFHQNVTYADKVLVIPNSMLDRIRKICGDRAELFPQLTTFFQDSGILTERVKEILNKIPSPRVIYTGEIGSRIDMDLYFLSAKSFGNCSFISFHSDTFERKGNLFKLPWLNKNEIFQVLQNCSVGYMPYDITKNHNLHCVPLKLFEYLQVGIPVVSTNLINLTTFNSVIKISKSHNDFIYDLKSGISEALNDPIRERRKALGIKHSTKYQKERIKKIIQDF